MTLRIELRRLVLSDAPVSIYKGIFAKYKITSKSKVAQKQ